MGPGKGTGTGTSGGTQAVSQSVGKWGKEEGVRETEREPARERASLPIHIMLALSAAADSACLPAGCGYMTVSQPASQRPLGGVVEYFSVVVVALHVESW